MLLVTVPAVNWSTFCWLERNFSLLTTVRTDDFVHCSGTTIRPTTHRPSTPPIIRDTFPVPLLGYRPSESLSRPTITLIISVGHPLGSAMSLQCLDSLHMILLLGKAHRGLSVFGLRA